MASGPVVEATLGLDTTAFQRGLARANAAAAGFKGAVEKLGLSSLLGPLTQGAGAGIVVGAIALSLRAGANEAARLRDEAEKTGTALGESESRAAAMSDRLSFALQTIKQMSMSLAGSLSGAFDSISEAFSGGDRFFGIGASDREQSSVEIAARLREQERDIARLLAMQADQQRDLAETESLRRRIADRRAQIQLDSMTDSERELELTRRKINLESDLRMISGNSIADGKRRAEIELEILEVTRQLQGAKDRVAQADKAQLDEIAALQFRLDRERADSRFEDLSIADQIADVEGQLAAFAEMRAQADASTVRGRRDILESDLATLGAQRKLADLNRQKREQDERRLEIEREIASLSEQRAQALQRSGEIASGFTGGEFTEQDVAALGSSVDQRDLKRIQSMRERARQQRLRAANADDPSVAESARKRAEGIEERANRIEERQFPALAAARREQAQQFDRQARMLQEQIEIQTAIRENLQNANSR